MGFEMDHSKNDNFEFFVLTMAPDVPSISVEANCVEFYDNGYVRFVTRVHTTSYGITDYEYRSMTPIYGEVKTKTDEIVMVVKNFTKIEPVFKEATSEL